MEKGIEAFPKQGVGISERWLGTGLITGNWEPGLLCEPVKAFLWFLPSLTL